MSLISGSNSLTPAIAGALDLRAAIVEKVVFGETVGCDLQVCSQYDGLLFGVLFGQREKHLCCCSCRIAVRLTVLIKNGMSTTDRHKAVTNIRADGRTIGAHMRLPVREAVKNLVSDY